ncbi:MAG: hypothetical protein IT386_07155 [Deltaproteobacteria bacterium]|nr:hypothetical protein [Deltaproteobacteria bacterium]
MERKKSVVFAAETFNLAEVTRMLEIAKVSQRSFECVFTSYDAARRNHRHIESAGFRIVELQPPMTQEKVERFWAVDHGEKLGEIISTADVRQRVRSEMALYREVEAAAVVTGFCLSVPISARAAGVPLVWVNQTTWMAEYVARHATWPDAYDAPALRVIPDALKDRVTRLVTPVFATLLARPFSRVARELGLAPFRHLDLVWGDHNLIAESPAFSGVALPDRLRDKSVFIGPLIARLDVPIPDAVVRLPKDRPIVYFAMGSSGAERVVLEILRAFEGKPYRVIAPVAELARDAGFVAPPNVVVTGWLPADRVNPMARVSVIHGGIGTVMTACLSGTPIVGIPNGLVEQEYNLDCIVRRGAGVRLRLRRFTAADVIAQVDRLCDDAAARACVQDLRSELLAWDGPENAARYLESHFA